MVKLPTLSGDELIRLLLHEGFHKVRQKGSHVSLSKSTPVGELHTVVPLHKELAKGTLLSILKQCQISREMLEKMIH
jgi:predicted RNA binding protein YcfA (HicA-like mRNA interferase family)